MRGVGQCLCLFIWAGSVVPTVGTGWSALRVGPTPSTPTGFNHDAPAGSEPTWPMLGNTTRALPANPAADGATLGPMSGISLDMPAALDASRFGRRLSRKGCVAAGSLYPEIAVCDDEDCTNLHHDGQVHTGTRISILLKITNDCIDKHDRETAAWLAGDALEDLLNVNVVFGKFISADFATLDSPKLMRTYFEGARPLLLPATPKVDCPSSVLDCKSWLQSQGGGNFDTNLVMYSAIVTLRREKTSLVEISARLRDRSIRITKDCEREEGTAWGSTTIMVLGPSERFFQKWSRAIVGSASASRHPWVAIEALLATSVVMLQAIVILRRRSGGRPSALERSSGDPGVTDGLVQRQEAVDEFM